jgi:hypothetical protein
VSLRGEKYDKNALTAAHKRYPLGSRVNAPSPKAMASDNRLEALFRPEAGNRLATRSGPT